MLIRHLLMVAALACPLAAVAEEIVVEICSFQREHSGAGIRQLADHGYRIVSSTEGLALERRTADGKWYGLGAVNFQVSQDHRTYLSRHDQNALLGVALLSIADSSKSVLLIHNAYGFNSSNARAGVMLQGDCHRP